MVDCKMSVKVSAGISRSIWYLLVDLRACAIARKTAALLLEVAVMVAIFAIIYGWYSVLPLPMVDRGQNSEQIPVVFRAKCLFLHASVPFLNGSSSGSPSRTHNLEVV
jgi:hypothetical protein